MPQLLQGQYDEQAAADTFKEALQEWRKGREVSHSDDKNYGKQQSSVA